MQSKGDPFHGKSTQEINLMILYDKNLYFDRKLHSNLLQSNFCTYSPFEKEDTDRKRFSQIFGQMVENKEKDFNPSQLNLSLRQSRGVASVLCMAISDALGACTEFQEYNPKGYDYILDGFSDIQNQIDQKNLRRRSGKTTVWTDDASMGFAMAYSFLLNDYKFVPKHMRYMFHLWWKHGLGNGGRQHSIGLGGNISISMDQFQKNQVEQSKRRLNNKASNMADNNQTDYANKGKQNNSGNGSLMRLAPIPVAFSNDLQQAMNMSEKSSLITHNGLEAKECCRLMAAIIVALINRGDDQIQAKGKGNKQKSENHPKWKQTIDKVCAEFKSDVKSVTYLAQSKQEPQQLYEEQKKNNKAFGIFNADSSDRNWNWKDENFRYSKTRNEQQPGYIGSYCMDALAMALHTVWHTSSYKECALRNTNMGGDCDSVGSIAGQIAGAVYGIDWETLGLYSQMEDFTQKRFEAFLVGYKMINRKGLNDGKVKKGKIEEEKMEIEE